MHHIRDLGGWLSHAYNRLGSDDTVTANDVAGTSAQEEAGLQGITEDLIII